MIPSRILILGLLGSLPLAAGAAETIAALANDSMSAAKRDLEALKTDPLLQPKAAPQMELPPTLELPSTSPPVRLLSPEDLRKKRGEPGSPGNKAKSPNWLVEAMQKNSPVRRPGEPQGEAERRAEENSGDNLDKASEGVDPLTGRPIAPVNSKMDREESVKVRGAKETKDTALPNPLDRYMGDWMSPKDYALLGTKVGGAPSASRVDSAGGPSASGPWSADDASPLPLSRGSSFSFDAPAANAPELRRDNPYMAPLALSPPMDTTVNVIPSQVTSPFSPSGPPASASSLFTPATVPDARPASQLQETLKRSSDDKYFPQLKRF